MEEDFWYVVPILDFTSLQYFHLYTKFCEVNETTSILQNIQNSIKFETFLRFWPN